MVRPGIVSSAEIGAADQQSVCVDLDQTTLRCPRAKLVTDGKAEPAKVRMLVPYVAG